MTNWPGRTEVTSAPTASTIPQYSCPIGVGPLISFAPRYGHRSEPPTQVAEIRRTASVGSTIVASSSCSRRTSPGAWSTAPRIVVVLSAVGRFLVAVSRAGPVHASATELIHHQVGDGPAPPGVGGVGPDAAGQQVAEHPAGDPRLVGADGVVAGEPRGGHQAGAGLAGGPGGGPPPPPGRAPARG